jgi:hypothetical protein
VRKVLVVEVDVEGVFLVILSGIMGELGEVS